MSHHVIPSFGPYDRQAELDAIEALAEQLADEQGDILAERESRCRRSDVNPLTGRAYTIANCGCEMCAETVAEWQADDRVVDLFDEGGW